MANGYVPRFMRGPPSYAQLPGQQRRFPFPIAGQQQQQQLAANDPAALFSGGAAGEPPTCAFPNAFPATGPNIVQRFWIRLFAPLVSLVLWLYAQLQWLNATLRAIDLHLLGHELTIAVAENSWAIFIGLVVVALCSVAAYIFAPKGENQMVWRSTLILSFASCYIMWAITFLAQWHPLIVPRMSELRPEP